MVTSHGCLVSRSCCLWWHPAVSADGVADGGEWVAAAERHAALRQAFSCLPPDSQHLIALLIADPPVHYAEISARLGIPVGTIGPNRSRCLDKLRRDPAIAALINAAEATQPSTKRPSRRPVRKMRT